MRGFIVKFVYILYKSGCKIWGSGYFVINNKLIFNQQQKYYTFIFSKDFFEDSFPLKIWIEARWSQWYFYFWSSNKYYVNKDFPPNLKDQ